MNQVRVMCNASPVIGLLAINKLPLLWKLFVEVVQYPFVAAIKVNIYDDFFIDFRVIGLLLNS